ncbi:hypothetical protein E4T66_12540 [Sinimarinibacterium sp. CAU 1509]|uniref:hypothetical protein n=1 Tax=Sinimarinibacterium sp. CAU 1509 TaxID=2562283 RepID=UPI0010ABA38C|nr:hypothetical protein [Sinimarinibacterium sp. CAU 1509]TJY60004.1 hypothetical protein E4T66_12540 [Sinimarinibacterium sp. CAU 1509]
MSIRPEAGVQTDETKSAALNLCLALCERLGDGYTLDSCSSGGRRATMGSEAQRLSLQPVWLIRCPDGGCVEIRSGEREWLCRAAAWPNVERIGLRRTFQQVLEVRVSPQRDADALAADLRRRLFLPYAKALSAARASARQYRSAWQALSEQLNDAGLNLQEAQPVGRTLQLQRPYAPLEADGLRLPSVSTTIVGMQDLTPVVGVDVRNLSAQEAAELHRFLEAMLARRNQGQLRLCA